MASLYDPAFTNEELLKQVGLRHRRINFDYKYISEFEYVNQRLLSNINWTDVDFNVPAIEALNEVQGIYMFYINPYSFSMANHPTGEILLYIGQASNLKKRLRKYFYYPNSKLASDQEKRYMVLFFSTLLKLKIYETGDIPPADLDIMEYSLIDSILPPFNLEFKSQFTQQYRRVIYHV